MFRFLSLAGIAVLAAGVTLATPAMSQAQSHWGYGNRGYGGYYGRGGYGSYYGHGSHYGHGGYHGHDGYHGHGGYHDHGGYGGYYGRRAIPHATTLHWTPFRGLHTHGHVHVPHRGHYHTYPY